MNGRTILTCLDAATGAIKWRSREPGDGFPTLVGDRIVFVTKTHTLHVGPASPVGWKEQARVDLFDALVRTAPTVVGKSVFARSMGELARVDWTAAATMAVEATRPSVASPTFARFLTGLGREPDKAAAVDRFLATVKDGPLVDPPDGVVFSTAATRGRVEKIEFASTLRPGARQTLHVYVPFGYNDTTDRHPAAYVLDGDMARAQGLVPGSLDHLMPSRVAPALVVFHGRMDWGTATPADAETMALENEILVKEIVPLIDGRFRTLATPAGRAIVGPWVTGIAATHLAFHDAGVFGALGLQSLFMLDTDRFAIEQRARTAAESGLRVYHDWASTAMRPREGRQTSARRTAGLTNTCGRKGSSRPAAKRWTALDGRAGAIEQTFCSLHSSRPSKADEVSVACQADYC